MARLKSQKEPFQMIASLMMYARAELAGPNGRYWARIRSELAARGIDAPENLSNDRDTMEVWSSPELVLSQTCGMPYRLWLHNNVNLVGTPDFGLAGCEPGYYNSAIVVRADDARQTLGDFRDATFAFNQTHSQSGFAAAYAHTTNAGFWFANRVQSHGHGASAQFVAQGTADIAAIDAVTWRLIQQFDDFARHLRVLEFTEPTPGLPYITSATADTNGIRAAIIAAIEGLSTKDKSELGLSSFVTIPKETYLAVQNPPENAA
jgi:ABC-type phosphate/phosphonate transport system substrate-binding protein